MNSFECLIKSIRVILHLKIVLTNNMGNNRIIIFDHKKCIKIITICVRYRVRYSLCLSFWKGVTCVTILRVVGKRINLFSVFMEEMKMLLKSSQFVPRVEDGFFVHTGNI